MARNTLDPTNVEDKPQRDNNVQITTEQRRSAGRPSGIPATELEQAQTRRGRRHARRLDRRRVQLARPWVSEDRVFALAGLGLWRGGRGWAVTYFAKTLFTPAGVDIYARKKEGLSAELLGKIRAEMGAVESVDVKKLAELIFEIRHD